MVMGRPLRSTRVKVPRKPPRGSSVLPITGNFASSFNGTTASFIGTVGTPVTDFRQFYLEDVSDFAMRRDTFNNELELKWPRWYASTAAVPWNRGQWTDADGTAEGTATAFATLVVSPSTTINSYHPFNITTLVQKWLSSGENRGVWFNCDTSSTSARVDIHGRLAANPPKLTVVTTDGTFVLTDGYVGQFTEGSDAGIDSTLTARIQRNWATAIHWRTFDTEVTGTLISATMEVYITARHATLTQTVRVYEPRQPYVYVGGNGLSPRLGLANEVGESNLPAHADVYWAGDCSSANLFTHFDSEGDLASSRTNPAPLGDDNQIPTGRNPGTSPAEFVTDPDAPGTTYWRGRFQSTVDNHFSSSDSNTSVSAGALRSVNQLVLPEMVGPYEVDNNTVVDELYVRVYYMIEEDYLEGGEDPPEGIKAGLGISMRMGWWNTSSGWSAHTGNGQTPGDGKRAFYTAGQPIAFSSDTAPYDLWDYRGHSIRGHLGRCWESGTAYQNFRPLNTMVSHNGPYESPNPDQVGSEQVLNSTNTVFQKGVWHCVEGRVKLNTINMTALDAQGNGVGRADGIWEIWIDGVLQFQKNNLIWRHHPQFGLQGHWFTNQHGGVLGPVLGVISHFRYNHLVVANRYIGPNPVRLPSTSLPYTVPDVGNVTAIGRNTVFDVKPVSFTQNNWYYTLFNSEGGPVYVPTYSDHGAMVFACTGGHAHPDYTGALAFNFSTARWERHDNENGIPVNYPFSSGNVGFDVNLHTNGAPHYEVHYDGVQTQVPAPPHSYATLTYLNEGERGSVMHVTRGHVGLVSNNATGVHKFDLTTRLWSRATESLSVQNLTPETDVLWDEDRNRWWVVPRNLTSFRRVMYLDNADMTFKQSDPPMTTFPSSTVGDVSEGPTRVMFHDGLLIKNVGTLGLWCWDPDDPTTPWFQLTVSGTLPYVGNKWARYSNGKWYAFTGDTASSSVIRITPPVLPKTGTWTVDTVTLNGTLPARIGKDLPPTTTALHVSRFMYVDALDCLAWFPGRDHKVYIFKPE
jgi:hypothetical protein